MSGTPVNIPVMTIEDANKLIESGQNIIECLPTGQKRFITCVDGFEGAVDAVRKGQPVKGLEFFNPTDGSIQVLRQNGGVLVCYDSPGLEAKVIDYLAKNKDALKGAEGIKNFVKFLGENAGINPATGLADVWDSDIKWASKLTGAPEQIGNGTVFSGAKAQEAVQAIPVKVGTRFTGPTGTPQIAGTEGAYILRDSSGNMHMIQARQFSEAYSPVKAMTNVGKTAEARIPFSLNMSVSDATHLAGQKVGDAFRVVKGSKAGQAVGNAVGKVVSNPAIRKAGQILGRAAKGLGPIGTLLLVTDGKLVTKFSKGRVVEAATDVVKSIKDIKLTDFKELWNVVKEHPKELWKTFCDGYKMSMESLGIDLMPERFADVKTRQGYVKKTLEDEYGRPIIKNGEVQTEDTFYIATQSKSNPNQISFLQRMETEKIPVGIFDLDKGRVVAEYNEYSDENIRVRMRTEYDSTNVTTLEKRYGIGLSDFNRMSGLNFFPQTPIGKPTKITTETNFDGNNPNRDFGFNEEYTNIWCEKEIRNVKTEYPVYFKDGTKMASDIVVKSTVQRKTYPITEQEREHLFEIYNRDPSTLKPVKKAMLELIAKKDKEMQEHPDVGLCQEDISENTTYGREHYKENPDLKNIKTPDDPEFINQYDRAWVKVES